MFLGACTFIIACLIFAMANAPFGSSFSLGNPHSPFRREKGTSRFDIGLVFARPLSWVRCSFSWRWVGYLVGVRCFARFARLVLPAAGLLACFALCCASAWFLLFVKLAPLLVRVCAGRGQPLCPWDRGDKVVSSCWWVRACFIHPETLFQTLSQPQIPSTFRASQATSRVQVGFV